MHTERLASWHSQYYESSVCTVQHIKMTHVFLFTVISYSSANRQTCFVGVTAAWLTSSGCSSDCSQSEQTSSANGVQLHAEHTEHRDRQLRLHCGHKDKQSLAAWLLLTAMHTSLASFAVDLLKTKGTGIYACRACFQTVMDPTELSCTIHTAHIDFIQDSTPVPMSAGGKSIQ
jgi:hypothetical protein